MLVGVSDNDKCVSVSNGKCVYVTTDLHVPTLYLHIRQRLTLNRARFIGRWEEYKGTRIFHLSKKNPEKSRENTQSITHTCSPAA
jgi:hypothetical protein